MTTTSSFRELVTETSEAIEAQEQSARANATVNMELVRRGVFECIYADNDTTSRDRVFIRGTDSCGFLDGNEPFEDKTKRIAGYVNEFLPGVHQPQSTLCYAIQSSAEYMYEPRRIALKKYIEEIDSFPLSLAERLSSPEFINIHKTIFNGALYFRNTPYNGHSCELTLFAQNQPFQSNGAGRIRGGLQSVARGLGMIVRTGAGWAWSGTKVLAFSLPGAYFAAWSTTSEKWNNFTGKTLYGDFATDVTREAGGMAGAWYYPLDKGANFTLGDGIIASVYGVATGCYWPVPQIMAGVGALFTLTISKIGKTISKLGSASRIKAD